MLGLRALAEYDFQPKRAEDVRWSEIIEKRLYAQHLHTWKTHLFPPVIIGCLKLTLTPIIPVCLS